MRDGRLNNLSESTIEDYKEFIGYFIDYCDLQCVRSPKQLTNDLVKNYLEYRKTKPKRQDKTKFIKPISVSNHYRYVHRFCTYMVEEKILKHSPMEGMKPPRVPRYMIKPLRDHHIQAILSLLDDKKYLGSRNRAIILVLLDTGLRRSELLNMKVLDIYNNELSEMRSIFNVMGKGAKERTVAISRLTQKAINQYMKLRNSNLSQLWLTEERKPLQHDGIYMALRRLGKAAGITDVQFNPHAYRHTCGTEMLRNGANVFQVQDLLGHSTQAMTKRYTATLNSEDAAQAHVKFSPVAHLKKI